MDIQHPLIVQTIEGSNILSRSVKRNQFVGEDDARLSLPLRRVTIGPWCGAVSRPPHPLTARHMGGSGDLPITSPAMARVLKEIWGR